MASIINVDQVNEATSGNGVQIPGHVVQVVNTVDNSQVSIASATPTATGLAQSITPKFANSKLLVQIDASGVYNSVTLGGVDLFLYRDGSPVTLVSGEAVAGRFAFYHAYNTAGQSIIGSPFSKLVDAGSTSATTFQLYFSYSGSTGTAYVNINSTCSAITVTEIAQ